MRRMQRGCKTLHKDGKEEEERIKYKYALHLGTLQIHHIVHFTLIHRAFIS